MLKLYKKKYKFQNVNHVKYLETNYKNLKYKKYDIWKCFEILTKIKDETNIYPEMNEFDYACQVAENLENIDLENIYITELFTREELKYLPIKYKILFNKKIKDMYKNIKYWDWLPLIGLIHNLGKILLDKEFGKLPAWTVLGEIYPLEISFNKQNIFYEELLKDIKFDKKFSKFCGFDSLKMCYGFSNFLYNKFKSLNHRISQEGLYIIKYNMFYSWINRKKDYCRGYQYYANEKDWEMLPLLKLFDIYKNINIDINKKYQLNEIKKKYKKKINKILPKFIF